MVAINWAKLRTRIIEDTVGVVNGLLYDGLAKAQKDVPVRKVFEGGRQQVRFKTAEEIEADRGLRSRLGLAPEILATPKAVAAVRAAGLNPKAGRLIRNRTGLTNLETGEPAGRDDIYGFARVVTRSNRANSWETTGAKARHADNQLYRWEGARVLDRTEAHLAHRSDESFLTGRGRYELRTGRATAEQRILGGKRKPISVDLTTGKIQFSGGDSLGGTPTIGGGLRSTLRVAEAHVGQFPVIRGSLLAGDREHDYAKYQELGTRHNAAHPFLRPRLIEWKPLLKTRLKTAIGRYGR